MAKKKDAWERPADWPVGAKDNVDHSITFKCVGGPMHGNKVRLYEPFDAITFPYPNGPETYELTPPFTGSRGKWVLIHKMREVSDD